MQTNVRNTENARHRNSHSMLWIVAVVAGLMVLAYWAYAAYNDNTMDPSYNVSNTDNRVNMGTQLDRQAN